MAAAASARRPRGPADPGRPDRIARAAMRIVSIDGLSGLTHRAVAAAAGVPVSSTTYYFKTREDLIAAAMSHAMRAYAGQVARWSVGVTSSTLVDDLARLVALKTGSRAQRQRLVVGFELYLGALRHEPLRPISQAWDDILLDVLAELVPRRSANALLAAVSGLWLKAIIDGEPLDADEVAAVLWPIVDAADR
jgi:DNA-binding transcriptional regulator YbjK